MKVFKKIKIDYLGVSYTVIRVKPNYGDLCIFNSPDYVVRFKYGQTSTWILNENHQYIFKII
jgi:hypothetical protein